MKVCCRADDIVNRLGEQAKIMENDLNDWRDTIRNERGNFYHLNYFTAQQLLSLRYELGCFKEGRADRPIKPEIMALLQSVSLDITPQNVKDSLFDIIAILGEQAALNQLSAKDIQDSVTHRTNNDNSFEYNVPNRKINAKIHIQQHVPIDEHHQTVIDLVEAGFDLEQSIKAASKYPDDPSAAIDYLDDSNIEDGDTLFQSSGTVEELSLSSIVEPVVHSDGFGLEEESVPLFTQRQDSSMSNTSQTL